MLRKLPICCFAMLSVQMAAAQDSLKTWTLKMCLDYALENNIQLQQSRNSYLSGLEDTEEAKAALLPSLTASTTQGFTNYPSTNVSDRNTYTGTYGLNADLTLYEGGKLRTTVKQQKLQNRIDALTVAESENDIRIAIVQAYLQALYATESVEVAVNTAEVSRAQRDRAEELRKAGSISRVDFAQLESQYASDLYQVTTARTSLDNYRLQLKQLLELDITEEMNLATPVIQESEVLSALPAKAAIYATALEAMPEIKRGELAVESAELGIRQAQAGFYPSVSLGWEFTKLPFLEGNRILNYGKLRASFAQVGQAGNYYNNFYYTPTYGGGFYGYTPVSYPLPSGVSSYVPYYIVYDENLKPQNTTNYEVGIDLHLFNSRIKMEYTYSLQNVKDQIFSVPTDGSTGYQYMMTNAGKMRTNAHEFSINAAILQHKDYDLNLGINFTKIVNEVIELAPGVESIMLGGFVEPQVRAQAGCTYPNIYGTAFKRDEAGNLLLLNGLPQATGDSQNLGNCSPDFTMGINLGGRYKRLSLNTTWSWQQGGKMYHGTNMTLNYFGATKESLPYHEGTMVVDGIDEATGKKNTIEVSKQAYYQEYYNITESGIYDTSFVKLRDVTLTYQLPKIGIFDISIYGFARNILVWAELPNFDPESSQGNNNMSGYFERFSVPNTSSFGGGLTVKF